uniref:Uncharacterized protein n=1 Tax=viral metagenome TaxID=1070528 RepID=A0A6C0KL45_9ZZZZ
MESIIEGKRKKSIFSRKPKKSIFSRRKPARVKIRNSKSDYIKKLKTQIDQLTGLKNRLFAANNRLINKNNTLLDSVQYFRTTIFGNKDVKGLTDALNEEKLLNEKLRTQELGQSIKEGYAAGDSAYNALNTENQIVENQLRETANQHSIDDQLFKSLEEQTLTLSHLNVILSWILFGFILASAFLIWFSDMGLKDRLVAVKVVWLYVILVEIAEYILFYVFRYLKSWFWGTPYDASDFWKFPTLTVIDILIIILIFLSLFVH